MGEGLRIEKTRLSFLLIALLLTVWGSSFGPQGSTEAVFVQAFVQQGPVGRRCHNKTVTRAVGGLSPFPADTGPAGAVEGIEETHQDWCRRGFLFFKEGLLAEAETCFLKAAGGDAGTSEELPPPVAVAADAYFGLWKTLYLQRHANSRVRTRAADALRTALRLEPAWQETDSRLIASGAINQVAAAFTDDDSMADAGLQRACQCLRTGLAKHGYTAAGMESVFGVSSHPSLGGNTMGPYYTARSTDHTSPPPPPLERWSAQDLLTRLLLLGLTVSEKQVSEAVGAPFVEALHTLGLVGDSLVSAGATVGTSRSGSSSSSSSSSGDGRLTPFVQVFPLRPDAMLHSSSSSGGGGDSNSSSGEDLYFVTDCPPPTSTTLEKEPVMYIGPDSLGLVNSLRPLLETGRGQQEAEAGTDTETAAVASEYGPAGSEGRDGQQLVIQQRVSRAPAVRHILDLCCGSGIQGLVALAACLPSADSADYSATLVDINPRALRFSRLNAVLNSLSSHVHTRLGDLYDGLATDEGEGGPTCKGAGRGKTPGPKKKLKFDLILANPPFVPVPAESPTAAGIIAARRYDLFAADEGSSGEGVLSRVVGGAGAWLDAEGLGLVAVVSELANPDDTDLFSRKVRGWLQPQQQPPPPPPPPQQQQQQLLLLQEQQQQEEEEEEEERSAQRQWRISVLYADPPMSGREYITRRAGSPVEGRAWLESFEREGIHSFCPGFLFLSNEARPPPSPLTGSIAPADGTTTTTTTTSPPPPPTTTTTTSTSPLPTTTTNTTTTTTTTTIAASPAGAEMLRSAGEEQRAQPVAETGEALPFAFTFTPVQRLWSPHCEEAVATIRAAAVRTALEGGRAEEGRRCEKMQEGGG